MSKPTSTTGSIAFNLLTCWWPVEIGHRTATVCHLGNIGRILGRNLRWDPVADRFTGDDQANQLLDRPRRKGYELPEKV